MKIIALSLRRSGSTAFWQVFANHSGIKAFDEPENPKLKNLPMPHHKGTWGTILEVFERDEACFNRCFSPIPYTEELNTDLAPGFMDYLNYLTGEQEHWFIDMTRCNLKVSSLVQRFPDVQFVYLYRNPIGFVTSHMLPSYGKLKAKRDRLINRLSPVFWRRKGGFNTWSMERIYNHFISKFDDFDRALGITRQSNLKYAHEKLLYLWLINKRYIEQLNDSTLNGRVKMVFFDDFSLAPKETLDDLLMNTGFSSDEFETSHLRPVSKGRYSEDIRWISAMRHVGFSEAEITQFTTQ